MEYRFLGNTGLKVSLLSFGNWVTGHSPQEENTQIQIMKRAHELGINYFDTAEVYGFGIAETIMGKAIKQFNCDRKDFVISTKLLRAGPGQNDFGLSRKHVIEGLTNSLKRLDLSYVDIVFAHRPDYDTPISEACRAFHTVIEAGQAHYWGTSEWPVAMIVEAINYCNNFGLHPPVVEQCQYNMLVRNSMEKEYEWIFSKYRYGTTVWSPLASGILTGKYTQGIPKGSRFDINKNLDNLYNNYMGEKKKTETLKVVNQLIQLSKEIGYTPAQIALAWVIANTDTSTCILGASSLSQLEDNVKALELYKNWNNDLEQKCVDLLTNTTPEPHIDFRTWTPKKNRRELAIVERAKAKKPNTSSKL